MLSFSQCMHENSKILFMAAKCLLACQLLRNHVVVSASMEHMASVYLSFRPVPTQDGLCLARALRHF